LQLVIADKKITAMLEEESWKNVFQ
jgi:hypothetical protein